MVRCALFISVLLAALSVSTSGAATSIRPTLRVMDTDVAMVRGTGFKAHEHVRLVVGDGRRRVLLTTTGSGGGFTMRIATMNIGACTGFSITATGDRGSRAVYKRAPGVCQPPPAQ
jgi:hypothetical protein